MTQLNFGDYVQAFVVRNKTNKNEERGVGAIALYPTDNGQGSWIFMSLLTGKCIHRYQWDIIPITEDIVARVEDLTLLEGQPIIATNFTYEWREGVPIWREEDEDEGEDIDMEPHILPQPHIYEMKDDRSETDDDQRTIDLIGAQDPHPDLEPNENLVNDGKANLAVIIQKMMMGTSNHSMIIKKKCKMKEHTII